MFFFDITAIVFHFFGYSISYVELIGTLFGLFSIYFASRANILTWPTGLVNEVFLFILFFQVQLYADLFLQLYFFVVSIYGWYRWNSKSPDNRIAEMRLRTNVLLALGIGLGSLVAGFFFSNIHSYLPLYFKVPAAYPFMDSFVMVSSIVATVLMAKKKIESWYWWIAVDVVCIGIYFLKGIVFLSLEYIIFLGLASYGLFHWKKQLGHD
jgi:nicotinamide mononucleotide transporter